MFYSQFILAKKGPLGTIWIAAHLERKLRKNQVADTDIGVSVDSILFPDVPIALRLSSHLLLGVVRIYSRKVNYLFDDCSEALLKVKQAFRSTAVDLPPEESTAPYHSITLPETFDLDDFELPDSDIFQGNYVDHHVSTREQITLQDNMEGVVYSTSQFGLDERFGDGDTSGLDLEEELLLDKVAASGHGGVVLDLDSDPQASGQPMTPLEQDEDDEVMTQNSGMLAPATVDQIGRPIHNSEFIEYAHAPCTPGLMEEPNLSIVQEASAFDDHLELEDHNLTASETVENLENACNKLDPHHGNKNAEGWSLVNDMNPETVLDMPAEENGYSSGAKEIEQLKPQGDSPSTETAMEHISSEDTHLVYIPSSDVADPVKAISQLSEFSDLQNGVISNNEPGIHSIEAVNVDGIEPRGIRLDEAEASPTLSLEASSLQEPCGNIEKPCALSDEVALNTESLGRPESGNPETETCQVPKDSMVGTIMHVLQPCNSNVKPNILNPEVDNSVDPGLPSKELQMCTLETSQREELPHAYEFSTEVQAEGCHATDVTESVLEKAQELVPDSIADNQADFSKVDDRPGSVISRGSRSENLDSSELPAPEKLLSVPESVADLPNDFLVESTPDNAVSVGGDIGGTGVEMISGKKRSFTESTLTVQSLNSVESFGMTYSKTTGEIPDDDDLLSSILVGRRSSVLKLKSTPLPPPEITSMKRPRTVPRATASKRKVLMDDIMVLHGDMIRQQLTSTEDIRRIRKKAPCTRTEIWMIQKQFLEEEIFIESLFTGSSTELLSMHSQTYDLSGIRVCQDEKATSSEAANDLEFSLGPNITKETGREVSAEDTLLRNDVEEEPAEIPENQQVGEHLLCSQVCDAQVQMKANSDLPEPIGSEHKLFEERAEMEIDGQSVAVADAINSENDIVGNMLSMSASSEVQPASFVKNSAADASLPLDESGVSPDQKLDTQSINMGVSTIDIHSGNGINTIEDSEKTDDGVHVVVTESKAGDMFLLGETEGGASAEIREEIQMDCSGPAVEEIGKNDLGLNENEVLAADLEADDKNPTSTGAFNEEFIVDSSHPMEINMDSKSDFLNDGGYPGGQEFDPQSIMDAEIVAGEHAATEGLFGIESFDYTIDGHDTGFLNVDDDDIAEEDNDCMPSTEETRFLENSGWSSRTRAVAKYLQSLFDKEAENGRKVLPMDNLLGGKTRKEASRMFFEALVLKTRDYIHVEQGNPFDSINIKPGMKLMKSDF